jgi:hypothetical protein
MEIAIAEVKVQVVVQARVVRVIQAAVVAALLQPPEKIIPTRLG